MNYSHIVIHALYLYCVEYRLDWSGCAKWMDVCHGVARWTRFIDSQWPTLATEMCLQSAYMAHHTASQCLTEPERCLLHFKPLHIPVHHKRLSIEHNEVHSD